MCVQRVDDSSNSAIHTTFSHFAAFFIVARTKRSIVERCIVFDAFALVTLVSKSTVCVKKKKDEVSGVKPSCKKRGPNFNELVFKVFRIPRKLENATIHSPAAEHLRRHSNRRVEIE